MEFPAWDCLPYDRVGPSAGIAAERMATLAGEPVGKTYGYAVATSFTDFAYQAMENLAFTTLDAGVVTDSTVGSSSAGRPLPELEGVVERTKGAGLQVIAADKWTKADIRTFVFEHTQNSIAHLKRTERMAGAIVAEDEAARRPIVAGCW